SKAWPPARWGLFVECEYRGTLLFGHSVWCMHTSILVCIFHIHNERQTRQPWSEQTRPTRQNPRQEIGVASTRGLTQSLYNNNEPRFGGTNTQPAASCGMQRNNKPVLPSQNLKRFAAFASTRNNSGGDSGNKQPQAGCSLT
ncbi:unnamed protein product, partial [Ectocarpus sp. 13 AM-2016]